MLTRDEVIWGYRYLLNGDPQNGAAIENHMRAHGDWRGFRQVLIEVLERSRDSRLPRFGQKWVAAEIFGGARLIWLDLMDDYVSRGCLYDAYEPTETELVRKHLKPGDVFLDVGANIGWYSLLASTIVGDGGHVYAFEPRRPTVEYLRRSVSMNRVDALVTIYDFGLDENDGEQLLAWPKNTRNPGHSALAMSPVADEDDAIPIRVRALDAVGLSKVDFIKIDVEGAEMRVLEGGKATIDSNRPVVLSELYPEQLQTVSRSTPREFFSWFSMRNYRAYIADVERMGAEIDDFPSDWYKEVINVILIPS